MGSRESVFVYSDRCSPKSILSNDRPTGIESGFNRRVGSYDTLRSRQGSGIGDRIAPGFRMISQNSSKFPEPGVVDLVDALQLDRTTNNFRLASFVPAPRLQFFPKRLSPI